MPISLTEKRHLLWLKQTCARSTESGRPLEQCHSGSRSQTVPENGGQHVSHRQQFPPRGLSEGLCLRMNKLFWHPFCGRVKIPWLFLFLSQIILNSCLNNLQIKLIQMKICVFQLLYLLFPSLVSLLLQLHIYIFFK